jgi:hypothetical protein
VGTVSVATDVMTAASIIPIQQNSVQIISDSRARPTENWF